MLKDLVVDVAPREGTGKNESRRLRRDGLIPGIVYGGDRNPVPIAVDPRTVLEVLRSESGSNTIFTLRLGGQEDRKRTVMIREVQRDPLAGRLIHADFVRIDMTREITVRVPIHLTGTPAGVKTEGGLLEFVTRELEIACLPADIPGSIDVDVSELHVNQNLAASDVKLPERVRLLSDPSLTLVVIAVPKAEEEVAAPVAEEEAVAGAEPEVIRKGKEAAGEEGEEAAEPKKEAKGESKGPAKGESKGSGKGEGKGESKRS